MGRGCSVSDRRREIDQFKSIALVPRVSSAALDREISQFKSRAGYYHQIIQCAVPRFTVHFAPCILIRYHRYGTFWR